MGILKKSIYGGELTRYINQKKKPNVLQACKCPLCDKVYRLEYFFNKQLEYGESVKYDFSCGLVLSNLKEKKLFSGQINRNLFWSNE